jgi:hypothetical protein
MAAGETRAHFRSVRDLCTLRRDLPDAPPILGRPERVQYFCALIRIGVALGRAAALFDAASPTLRLDRVQHAARTRKAILRTRPGR